MMEAYRKAMKERVFMEGQLILKTIEQDRRGFAGPSKFSPR